ncbi:LOW QUALITY PROTEIN: hypothetical protein TorRG33x02_266810 [Trema orientale]|uniref:Uncharacterized protein n=1 Tax=Trema orientale TaxID=63057 RepID=A0A2P5D0K8_TREOI|nr:LOW QUALITY PROTEIN: hypothetical protein TorRG33x02_266810 [Trema orientale]
MSLSHLRDIKKRKRHYQQAFPQSYIPHYVLVPFPVTHIGPASKTGFLGLALCPHSEVMSIVDDMALFKRIIFSKKLMGFIIFKFSSVSLKKMEVNFPRSINERMMRSRPTLMSKVAPSVT